MTYEPKHQPHYAQQPPQEPVTYDEPSRYNPSANVPPTPQRQAAGRVALSRYPCNGLRGRVARVGHP